MITKFDIEIAIEAGKRERKIYLREQQIASWRTYGKTFKLTEQERIEASREVEELVLTIPDVITQAIKVKEDLPTLFSYVTNIYGAKDVRDTRIDVYKESLLAEKLIELDLAPAITGTRKWIADPLASTYSYTREEYYRVLGINLCTI